SLQCFCGLARWLRTLEGVGAHDSPTFCLRALRVLARKINLDCLVLNAKTRRRKKGRTACGWSPGSAEGRSHRGSPQKTRRRFSLRYSEPLRPPPLGRPSRLRAFAPPRSKRKTFQI